MTATVEISLRALSGSRVPTIPLETASVNKEMGRVLIRRGGETIAAGESTLSPPVYGAETLRCRSRDFLVYCDLSLAVVKI